MDFIASLIRTFVYTIVGFIVFIWLFAKLPMLMGILVVIAPFAIIVWAFSK